MSFRLTNELFQSARTVVREGQIKRSLEVKVTDTGAVTDASDQPLDILPLGNQGDHCVTEINFHLPTQLQDGYFGYFLVDLEDEIYIQKCEMITESSGKIANAWIEEKITFNKNKELNCLFVAIEADLDAGDNITEETEIFVTDEFYGSVQDNFLTSGWHTGLVAGDDVISGEHNVIDGTPAQEQPTEYTPMTWVDGESRLNAANMNNIMLGIEEAKNNLIEVTYSKLKELRDNSQLIPGRFYRITDYTCTTTQADTSSAGHVFDIIVKADDVNKLNEEASAILHEGDTYFSNSKLESWQLKYCLDNDTNRFSWADSTNGKGVIYRVIDEFGNDVPYDFKNILFTKSEKYTNAYTFSYTEDSVIKDASILGISKNCYNNIMKEDIEHHKQQLNFNVFYSTSMTFDCYSNTFSNDCSNNTFGNNCHYNTFGNDCSSNTFGSYYYDNTFGNKCHYNTFGNECFSNTFGDVCYSNTFGNNCYSNTFSNDCSSNTFGNNCYSNTFGNNCSSNTFDSNCSNNAFGNKSSSNTFGSYCYDNIFVNKCNYNTFGNRCYYNTFGNRCNSNTFGGSSSAINYCQYNTLDNGCSYLYLNTTGTGSSSNCLQNVHIHSGVAGSSSSNRRTITVDRNLAYSTDIYANNSKTIILD